MSKLWLIQLFWVALALPGYALLRRWDPESLRQGVLFGLGRCYLASLMLLTPCSVVGYLARWPLWSLSACYVCAVVLSAIATLIERPDLRALQRPTLLAAVSGTLVCVDLWLGLRAGTHVHGDARYHIARVRMLMEAGLNNWDPIIPQQRLDIIYHTNLYHALIAVSGQLTRSDAALAWLGTWPFAKLLTAAGAYQFAHTLFGSRACAWSASVAALAAQSSYSVLPFPNALAPMALIPMGLSAAISLVSPRGSAMDAAWLAASAAALAQFHVLNAVFLGLVVGPYLASALALRVMRRRQHTRLLALGLVACGASLPWLLVAGGPRLVAMLETAPLFQSSNATPKASPPTRAHKPNHPRQPAQHSKAPRKVYKAEHFRQLGSGYAMFDPSHLRGMHDANLVALLLLGVALAWRPPKQLWALTGFISITSAWLLVPPLCSVLLRITSAPWAAMRITQVLNVASITVLPAVPMMWLERLHMRGRKRAALQLMAAAAALWLGLDQGTHGKPWTRHDLWHNALSFRARAQWRSIAARRRLLCPHLPAGATVMAHPRWDYGLPMHCRDFAVALAPERGWHGVPYMDRRRADVEEFFRKQTTGERRLQLMRKYQTQHVYTTNRLARRIVTSLPDRSRVLAGTRKGAVVFIDLP